MVTRVRVEALGLRYPSGTEALRDVSLELSDGELLCVLGPNGAGKSSLVRALGGTSAASVEGSIELRGSQALENARRLSVRERARRLAIVPQSLDVPGSWTVHELLHAARYAWRGRFARLGQRDQELVQLAMQRSEIEPFAQRRLSELSGGERQRALLGRALAQDTPALLLDEPASSLDPQHRLQLFELLEKLAHEGRALLVVTHDLNLAAQFASRVILLHRGRVHADGAPQELLRPAALAELYGESFLSGTAPTPRGERPWLVPWRVERMLPKPSSSKSPASK